MKFTPEEVAQMAREAGCVDPMVFAASYQRLVAIVAERAVQAEREALAKHFEDHWRDRWTDEQIAEEIRARAVSDVSSLSDWSDEETGEDDPRAWLDSRAKRAATQPNPRQAAQKEAP